MTSSPIRRSFLPLFGLVALAVAGCTSASTGAAQPAESTTAPQSAESGPAHPGTDELASLNPCDLLSSSDIQQLDLGPGKPESPADSRGCGWDQSGNYSVGIEIMAKRGISKLNPSGETVVHTTIGKHDAVQLSDVSGCNINMEITSSSQVGVYIDGAGSEDHLCYLANQYATLIEPRLPAERK